MKKRDLKAMIKHAYKVQSETKGTMVCFNIYADGIYILDTEEDNVIDITRTEQEAIDQCEGINSGEFSDGVKSKCYYKPTLIDADSGECITRTNFHLYKK